MRLLTAASARPAPTAITSHSVLGSVGTPPGLSAMTLRRAQRRPTRRRLIARAGLDEAHKDVHTDYYQVLGVPPEADNGELRAAFRTLAKAFHPDVAGRGADTDGVFQLVKTAYGVLSHPQSRSMYDAGRSLFGNSSAFGDFTGLPLSKNSCPSKPYAHFVDENSCIGCRACVFEAPNTFAVDETHGKVRVAHQWADHEQNIDIAMEICPVHNPPPPPRLLLSGLPNVCMRQMDASDDVRCMAWI